MGNLKCGHCKYLDLNTTSSWNKDSYLCLYNSNSWSKNYKKITDTPCSYFIKDEKRMNTNSGSTFKPSGCYITTIVCEILELGDDCDVLTTLRYFRENYLKLYHIPLLVEYDEIGPEICEYIRFEKDNYNLCEGLYKYFLIPCVLAVKNNDLEEATNIYVNLVNYLKDDYSLIYERKDIKDIDLNELDMNTLGKGRIKIRHA